MRSGIKGLLIVAGTVVAYLAALQAGFVWDDDNYVVANPTLRNLEGLWRIWFEPLSTPQYYPLTFATLWLEYRVWALDPFGYHLTNVLLHALNAVLFWRVLWLLRVPGAWLAAAIFALHPIEVESVAWITERKNVLSGAFYLGAALAYFRFSPPESSDRGSTAWYALALVLFAAALLSKTVTCSLPAALLLVYVWKRQRLDRRDLAALLPFFLIGLAGAATTVWVEREHVGAQGVDWMFSAVERCLIAGRVLWFYIWTLVWPSNLAFMYPRWQIDAAVWWQYVFPVAAVAVVVGLAAFRRRLGDGPLIAVLFYAGTLVPALGFFNVYPMRYSFVADHFAYLATLGPIALAAALAVKAADALAIPRVPRDVAAVGLLAVLGFLTWRQGRVYEDPESLWTDTVAKNPSSWAVRVNLGGVYADQGLIDEAIAEMQASVELFPSAPETHNALGAMWEQQGDLVRAEAAFREALRLESRYYEAHTNLGIVYTSLGKFDDAFSHFAVAIRLKPQYADAYYNAALAFAEVGRHTEAARHFGHVLLLVPDHAGAHEGMCGVLVDEGRIEDALRHCQEAVRLQGESPAVHDHLARALRAAGRLDAAQKHEQAAAEMSRRLAELHRNQALRLAEEGRPRTAIAHFVEALRLEPEDSVAIGGLQQLRAGQDS